MWSLLLDCHPPRAASELSELIDTSAIDPMVLSRQLVGSHQVQNQLPGMANQSSVSATVTQPPVLQASSTTFSTVARAPIASNTNTSSASLSQSFLFPPLSDAKVRRRLGVRFQQQSTQIKIGRHHRTKTPVARQQAINTLDSAPELMLNIMHKRGCNCNPHPPLIDHALSVSLDLRYPHASGGGSGVPPHSSTFEVIPLCSLAAHAIYSLVA